MKRKVILTIPERPWAGLAFPLGHKQGRVLAARQRTGSAGKTIEILVNIEDSIEARENGYPRFP